TDIYSCGVILYKMITGKTPYKSETATGLITKLMTEAPTPMSRHVSTVDPRIEEIVDHAMQKEKADRFQTAGEMRQAIRDVLEGTGVSVDATHPPVGTSPPSQSEDLPRRGFEITRAPSPGSTIPPGTIPPNAPPFDPTLQLP